MQVALLRHCCRGLAGQAGLDKDGLLGPGLRLRVWVVGRELSSVRGCRVQSLLDGD
jgi:hypothetical protein